jgi:hypothetical protein
MIDMYKLPNLVTEIKRARLRWLSHVERMPASRLAKKIYSGKPEGRRKIGRPRTRWLDDVEANIRKMGFRGWRRTDRNGGNSSRRPRPFKGCSTME